LLFAGQVLCNSLEELLEGNAMSTDRCVDLRSGHTLERDNGVVAEQDLRSTATDSRRKRIDSWRTRTVWKEPFKRLIVPFAPKLAIVNSLPPKVTPWPPVAL
jgi:hypothetical protein